MCGTPFLYRGSTRRIIPEVLKTASVHGMVTPLSDRIAERSLMAPIHCGYAYRAFLPHHVHPLGEICARTGRGLLELSYGNGVGKAPSIFPRGMMVLIN